MPLSSPEKSRHAPNHPPYGYQREGDKFVEYVGESQVIDLIQKKRTQGASIRAIAEELNGKGIKPKKAAQWNPSSVHKDLNRVA